MIRAALDDSSAPLFRKMLAARLGYWPPRHVVIVRLSALGDVVHTLPLAATLRRYFPATRLSWVVQGSLAPLLTDNPDLDRVVPVDLRTWKSARGLSRAWAVRDAFRRDRPDLALDAQGLFKSAAVARLTRARVCVGLARQLRREPLSSCLSSLTISPPAAELQIVRPRLAPLTVPCDGEAEAREDTASGASTRYLHGLHSVQRHLALAWGLGAWPPMITYALPRDAAAEAAIDTFLGSLAGAEARVGINVGGAWPTKIWPPAAVARVIEEIVERRLGVPVLVWGPKERPLVDAVLAGVTRAVRRGAAVAPATNLAELIALLRRLDVLISGDTGPLHLAVAAGTPTVGLFGPTAARTSGPFDDSCRTPGRRSRHRTISVDLPCGPCYRRDCDRWICMPAISPELVVAELRAALDRSDTQAI
ncbi:MAG: glycosyltransferase family 9 protein [Candidatus Schekmanbacteria bacterium]|nr:glycosyltransferase family 9 protein [Candidatus Schekmanbacteria bacterium]